MMAYRVGPLSVCPEQPATGYGDSERMSKIRDAAKALLDSAHFKASLRGWFVDHQYMVDLREAITEPDPMTEALRFLKGAASLIRAELGTEWSDHADDIDEFLAKQKSGAT
jgi:hypothetical protein